MQFSDKDVLKIGTRRSQLAVRQADIAGSFIKEKLGLDYDLIKISTKGDLNLESSLPYFGDKNLFTHELELELLRGEIDMIVHSLKDLSTEIHPDTVICTILKRDMVNDIVIFRDTKIQNLKDLPQNSVVGTSSLRRIALLRRFYPHLAAKNIRGNIHTRISKLKDNTEYDAIILAAAGLERLNMINLIGQVLQWPHAVSQGAIAIQCLKKNKYAIKFASLSDFNTTICCIVERIMLKELQGGCSVPIGVKTEIKEDDFRIKGSLISIKGDKIFEVEYRKLEDCKEIGYEIEKDEYYIIDGTIVLKEMNVELIFKARYMGQRLSKSLLLNGAMEIINEARQIKKI